eukprot:4614454-Prymnesium_polylepis.1
MRDRRPVAVRSQCCMCGRTRRARLRQRASPVDLIQPCRAARTLLLAMLASSSRACVSSIAYVQ